ncbi:tetratricopeptide repeat protein [Streptomyces huasconensis]|uniref:tetratricopeptide repeat protein n=1 Tax=Streptomyces huasconensis TaxID=1854574 RepID=UPI001E3981FF|nr:MULTISPECIES: tetratricopeptide repeat protein [Streptomyces]UFQ15906.1 tetratricopeptide repeat protein [Streptomyces huasconensis]WCL85509.1 tetratricopeptide repeat protein [Streptomyces sp. JCM 35825]
MRSSVRRALVFSAAGSVALGAAYVLVPLDRGDASPPALGPVGRARVAVAAGRPAAPADLAALIGDREAHLRTHPRDEHSWAVLGSAYVARGARTADVAYYPKAEQALRTSLRTRSAGNPEALLGLTALANARHDFRAARMWGEQAVRQAPKRWAAYPALIDAYSGLGDAKGVGKALDSLKKLGPRSAVKARAGQVYRDRGWREDANAALTDAAALAETPAEQAASLHRVGELAWERGEPAVALRQYDAALAADPDHHASLAGRGRALAALGRTSEALHAYRSALTRQPLPEYAVELGELYEALKLRPAARAQYDVVRARVKEESAGGVNNERVLGLFEADHGDPETAVARLKAEYKRHGNPQTADALGWALHRAGEGEKGLKLVTKAIAKGPRSALFAYHRGEIERQLGRYGAARRHIGEALRTNPYFSPLHVPRAKRALAALGEPPEGGPEEVYESAPAAAPGPERPRRTEPGGSAPGSAQRQPSRRQVAPRQASPRPWTSRRAAPSTPRRSSPSAPARVRTASPGR